MIARSSAVVEFAMAGLYGRSEYENTKTPRENTKNTKPPEKKE